MIYNTITFKNICKHSFIRRDIPVQTYIPIDEFLIRMDCLNTILNNN